MSLKERMQQIAQEEALKAIKLEEGVLYDAIIENAYLARNQKNLNTVVLEAKIVAPNKDYDSKIIKKMFVIDENNPIKLQTDIAIKDLFNFLTQFDFEFETEKDLAQKLPSLVDKKVKVTVVWKENKQNKDRPWANYTIIKA